MLPLSFLNFPNKNETFGAFSPAQTKVGRLLFPEAL